MGGVLHEGSIFIFFLLAELFPTKWEGYCVQFRLSDSKKGYIILEGYFIWEGA